MFSKLLQIFFIIHWIKMIDQSDSISCYTCTSELDINCITMQQKLPTIHCFEKCYSYYSTLDRITYRGCKTDRIAPEHCNTNICRQCSISNCNLIQIPINRRYCYQCSGPDCINPNSSLNHPCINYYVSDRCYSMIKNDVVYRGCESEVPLKFKETNINMEIDIIEYCDVSNILKIGCNYHKPFSPSLLECIHCNSSTNFSCRFQQDPAIAVKCMNEKKFNEREYCYTLQIDGNINNVQRGCLIDENSDFREMCLDHPLYCKLCNSDDTSACNVEQQFLETCYKCNSSTDTKCLYNPKNFVNCETKAISNDEVGCFHNIDESGVQRGCMVAIKSIPTLFDICKNGTTTCKTCFGELCNNRTEFQYCYVCDSIAELSCVQLTNIANIQTKRCDDYSDICQIRILKDGSTKRGCNKEITGGPCINENDICEVCDFNLCNKYKYPMDRMECIRCEINFDCTVELLPNSYKQLVCEFYDPFDKCYVVVDDQDDIYRGCISDNSVGVDKCGHAGDNCLICLKDACNNQPKLLPPSLSCIKCTDIDEKCPWGQNFNDGVICSHQITIGHTERCYEYLTDENKIFRDCFYDNSELCISDANCAQCTSKNCNNRNFIQQSCLQCQSSEKKKSCENNVTNLVSTPCKNMFLTYDTRGCYVLRIGDIIQRGCINDLLDNSYCQETDNCEVCYTDGCNTMDINSSVKILNNIKLLIIFIIYFMILTKLC